jgi:hypothetical protein
MSNRVGEFMKKYTFPVKTEWYDTCGKCEFCYGTQDFFCEHPQVILSKGKKQLVAHFDTMYPCDDDWKYIPIPDWCPLEDV